MDSNKGTFSDSDEVIFAVLIDDEINQSDEAELIDIEYFEETLEIDDKVVNTFEERRKKQFIAQSKTKKQWSIITFSIVIAIGFIALALLESPMYRIDSIQIESVQGEPMDKIESEQLNELSKSIVGQPMYRTSLEKVQSKIEEMPEIGSVTMRKSWPRTVEIKVEKRVAVGFVETDQGVTLIDAQGFVFAKAQEPPVGYPAFEGMSEIEFAKQIPDTTFTEILKQAPKEIQNQIVLVKIQDKEYSIELTDGIDIILGDNSSLKQKLAISWSILQTKKRLEIGYIDVSAPSLPVSGSPQLKV